MTSTEEPTAEADPVTEAAGVVFKIAAAVAVLVLAVPVLVAVVAYRQAPALVAQRAWFWRRRRAYLVVAVAGVVIAGGVLTFEALSVARYVREEIHGWNSAAAAVTGLWPWAVVGLVVSPLLVPAAWMFARRGIAAQVAARTMPDAVRQDRITEARHRGAQLDAVAIAQTMNAADGVGQPTRAALGVRIESGVKTLSERSHTPRRAVPDWETGRYVTLPGQLSAVRTIVLAESGHGKTVLLTSLVLAALSDGGRVVFIDAKGQHSDAAAMVEQIKQAGHTAEMVHGVRVLGEDVPAETAYEILTVQWPTSEGGSDYYRSRHRDVLRSALRGHHTSLASLLEFLQMPTTAAAWTQVPAEIRGVVTAEVEGKITAGQSAAQALRQAWGAAADRISGDGALLDFEQLSARFTILPVRPRQEADRMLGLAAMLAFGQHLNALQAATGRVESDDGPLLVVVDEFPQLVQAGIDPSSEAASLMETARSAGLGLVMAAQSTAGLGEKPEMRARLLLSGASVLLGATKDPEEAIKLAGTQRRLEAAESVAEGVVTSGRSQDTYVIPPDRVRGAPVGTWWLIHKGAVAEFSGLTPDHTLTKDPNGKRE